MKFLFIMTVAALLPFSLITAANANPEQVPFEPAQTNLEPSQTESIAPLSVQQDSELVSPDDRSNHLTNQARQINHNLNSGQTSAPQLRDLLDLPDGMIIRGSSRGGLGIGREY
jgi:hypothetical protein